MQAITPIAIQVFFGIDAIARKAREKMIRMPLVVEFCLLHCHEFFNLEKVEGGALAVSDNCPAGIPTDCLTRPLILY